MGLSDRSVSGPVDDHANKFARRSYYLHLQLIHHRLEFYVGAVWADFVAPVFCSYMLYHSSCKHTMHSRCTQYYGPAVLVSLFAFYAKRSPKYASAGSLACVERISEGRKVHRSPGPQAEKSLALKRPTRRRSPRTCCCGRPTGSHSREESQREPAGSMRRGPLFSASAKSVRWRTRREAIDPRRRAK